jgi:hypothetical protein
MPTPPSGPGVPQVLIDDVEAAELTSALVSMVVHAANGEATAEVCIVGPVSSSSRRMSLGTTLLGIEVPGQGRLFSGSVEGLESRIDIDGAPSSVVLAAGAAPDGRADPAASLRTGMELLSGSVRRTAGATTAHCLATTVGLRCGSPVTLLADDPDFTGDYRVTEVWYRFDAAHGLRVEFVARG